MIPKLEEDIPKLQNLLSEQEKILEDINESAKGAVFSYICYAWRVDQSIIVYYSQLVPKEMLNLEYLHAMKHRHSWRPVCSHAGHGDKQGTQQIRIRHTWHIQ